MNLSADLTPPSTLIIPANRSLPAAAADHGEATATGSHHPTRKAGQVVFTPDTIHDDLIEAYPDLEPVCRQIGFTRGMTLARWCSSPEWALLILARAGLPPRPAPALDWAHTSITAIIDHLVGIFHRSLRNELNRIAILIRDFTYRNPDHESIRFGHEFLNFAEDVHVRLDFEEIAVFTPCLDLDTQHVHGGVGRMSVDLPVKLDAMITNNDYSVHSLNQLLNQVAELMRRQSDPDLTIIRQGLAGLALELAVHATTEQNLLATEVLFAVERHQAQRDPAYCIRVR